MDQEAEVFGINKKENNMSWGERSCEKHGKCEIASMKTCNPDCIDYISNGKEPDTLGNINKTVSDTGNETEKPNKGVMIVASNLKHFSKTKEFVVLKGKVFNIQHVSPKKIILKLKGGVNKQHPLPSGVYCIKDKENLQNV